MIIRQNNKIIGDRVNYLNEMTKRYGEPFKNYRKKWEQLSQFKYLSDFPIQLDLDTVDSCNLKCKYCNTRNNFPRTPTNKKMPESLVKRIFNEVASNPAHDKTRALNIGSIAEPLMNETLIPKILSLGYDSGIIETFLHTNGQLLTEKTFKMLVDNGLTHLLISLDSINPNTYKKVRGGSLINVRNNINTILDYQKAEELILPFIHISFMDTSEAHPEKEDFIDYWKDRVDYVEMQPLVDWISSLQNKTITTKCPAPWQRLLIDPEGNIIPCCTAIPDTSFAEHCLGNLSETTLYSSWNGKKMVELRHAITTGTFGTFTFCKECHMRCNQ